VSQRITIKLDFSSGAALIGFAAMVWQQIGLGSFILLAVVLGILELLGSTARKIEASKDLEVPKPKL
jgi:hypothetical protein